MTWLTKKGLTICVASVLAMALPGGASARTPRPPAIVSVEVVTLATGQRLATAATTGRRLAGLHVCDLDTVICVAALPAGRNRWRTLLPPGESGHTIGAIGRAGRADFVWASFDQPRP